MASVDQEFKYDVFLSFRGEDTRYRFTGNLKNALAKKGVRTFMDDDDLQKGEEITPSLLKAIEESQIAIVVLSKNYASSSFCLQELSKILDTMKDKVGRFVMPVFYKVDPSDVRKLQKTFGEAMVKHKANSNLNKWKGSLYQVAELSGFHYKKSEMYECEFIEKIVEQVSCWIKPVVLHVGDHVVGLEHQKQHVTSLLNVESDDEINMVGIYGIGGIGKTTLALSVYNLIAHQFQGSYFLKNVKEISNINGLTYLQEMLLSQIIGEMKLTSVEQGITILQQRLKQKKVLLLLDDVDKEEQLQAIAGSSNWFGPGSRVIITTRDKRLLTSHRVEITYEVKGLNEKDAFELVAWKAFKKEFRPSYISVLLVENHGSNLDVNELLRPKAFETEEIFSGYVDLFKRVVAYAFGLPLALEVIGSQFVNKTIEECKHVLDRCERIPHEKIQMILQLSFDDLKEEEKSVFLDIACYFKGYKLTMVEQILHAHHGDIMKDQINVLVEKSLIKISDSGDVTLHDLVEVMGKEIVRRESPKDPGQRSRLWLPEDIADVLEGNTGTSKIEIIFFNCSIKVDWDGEAFKKMKNLRTLLFGHVDFSEILKHIPNSLRVLEWCIHPLSDLPSGFYPKKLAICKFGSCLTSNQFECANFLKKKFQNMRVLNFDHCKLLLQIPDISGLPNLEEFSIQNCEELIAIDKSVGFLSKLKILRFVNCTKIQSLPPLSLTSLEELYLSDCYSLETFPLMVYVLVGKLKILRVIRCTKIRMIPSHMLASLEELDLSDCTSLESFSPVVDGFGDKLKTMSVRGCIELKSIPLLKLDFLEKLDLSKCYRLESFPLVVDGFLGKLKTLLVKSCHDLKSIPTLQLDSLETLYLSCCYSLESFPYVVDRFLGKLKTLLVKNCPNLMSFPPLKLDLLETLDLSNCNRLEIFPPVVDGFLGKLKTLVVTNCHNLISIPLLKLDSLEKLDLSNCRSLESFPRVVDGMLDKLKFLSIKHCVMLKTIPPLRLTSLEWLDLSYCQSLESFPEILGEMRNVTNLYLDNTPINQLPFPYQNFTPPPTTMELLIYHRG